MAMAKRRFEVAKSDSLFQKSFLCFTGKFNWMHYAKDCMMTIIFPSGLKTNEPVLAYWQWDIDAKGEHSKAELKGTINVVGQDSNPPFIRILKGNTYYWFEGEIFEGDKVMKLVMWDQSHKVKKRIYRFRKYQRGIARLITDVHSGCINGQYYYHYETYVRVSGYLILMNLMEVLFGSEYFVQTILIHYYKSNENYMTYINKLGQCSNNINMTKLEDFKVFELYVPYLNILAHIAYILSLYFVVIAVNLMNYLMERNLKVRKLNGGINCRTLLIINSIIGVVELTFVYFTTFNILSQLIRMLTLLPYYILFVKTVNQYKRTLFKTAIQRLSQYGKNREELKRYNYFRYTINIICFGVLIAIIAQYLRSISICLSNILLFENCFFPFNMYSLFQDSFQSKQLINYLKLSYELGTMGNVVGSCILIAPFVLVTTMIWIKYVYKKIRGKSAVVFRYRVASSEEYS